MYRPVRVTAPADTPISLGDAKAHLRVDFHDEDLLIVSYIKAAVGHYDGWSGVLGRCLVSQQWRQDFDGFAGSLRLPFPDASQPVVTYRDASGAAQTVSGSSYVLHEDERGPYIALAPGAEWPVAGPARPAVSVTATYGFGAPSEVPDEIRAALLIHVQALYGRGAETGLQAGRDALIAPFRRLRP